MQSVKFYFWMARQMINGRKFTMEETMTYAVIYGDLDNDGVYRKGIKYITNMTRLSEAKQIKVLETLCRGGYLRQMEGDHCYMIIKASPSNEKI